MAGGAGFVGRLVVEALLAEGARVLVPTRRPGALEAATDGHDAGERMAVVGVRSWDDPVEIAVALADRAWVPDAAVVAVGGWWIGTPLLDLPPDAWRGLVESHLTAHFLAARALLPLLAGADPAYVALNGAAAREPMALSGPVSVAGAGQAMLLDVLRAEGTPVRLHEVAVLAAVAGDDRNLEPVASVTGRDVARAVLGVLEDPLSPLSVDVVGPAP